LVLPMAYPSIFRRTISRRQLSPVMSTVSSKSNAKNLYLQKKMLKPPRYNIFLGKFERFVLPAEEFGEDNPAGIAPLARPDRVQDAEGPELLADDLGLEAAWLAGQLGAEAAHKVGAAGAEEAQNLEAHRPEGGRGGAHAARLTELALGLRVVAPLWHKNYT
jgi:hypothetical protein